MRVALADPSPRDLPFVLRHLIPVINSPGSAVGVNYYGPDLLKPHRFADLQDAHSGVVWVSCRELRNGIVGDVFLAQLREFVC